MRTLGRRASPSAAIGLLLFALCLGVYISGLPPSITWSNAAADSGELATAVEVLGVPHPPGYPTYVLVGKLFSFLPVGDTAFRLNVMSAVAGAAAVVAVFFAGRYLVRLVALGLPGPAAAAENVGGAGQGRAQRRDSPAAYLPALVGSLAVAFAPIFWSQSIVAEVYTLNALFAAGIAWLALWWLWDIRAGGAAPSVTRLVLAAFIFGLGLGNHLTLAAVGVPLLALAALRIPSNRVRGWGLMGLGLLVGLAVYVYLPIAAAGNPVVNWGSPDRWSGFSWVVTAGPYRQFVFGVPLSEYDGRLTSWADLMLEQFNGVGVLLGLGGAWLLWRRDRLLGVALGLSFLMIAAYASFYETGDSFVFLIPSLLVAALWIAVAAHYLLVSVALPLLASSRFRTWQGLAMGALAAGLVLLIPGLSVLRSYPSAGGFDLDLSQDTTARAYGEEVFREVEPDAVVLTLLDGPVFSLGYQKYVVDRDSGVLLVGRNFLAFDWYLDDLRRRYPGLLPSELPEDFDGVLRAVVDEHLGRRAVYLTALDSALETDYILEERPLETECHGCGLFRVAGKNEESGG